MFVFNFYKNCIDKKWKWSYHFSVHMHDEKRRHSYLKKERCCRKIEGNKTFKPTGFPMKNLGSVEIELDEFEAMRLCDLDGKNQIEASEIMGISRGTIQRLLESGRKKLADALLNSKAINIKNSYTGGENKEG